MKVGYARLSTGDPEGLTIEMQHDRLQAAGCDRIYSEVISGNAARRPQWEALKQAIADGQITEVVSVRMDRLSRSWTAIGEVINLFSQPGAPRLTLLDEPEMDLNSISGRTVAGVLSSVAAGERERIVARATAGLKKRFASGRRIKIPFGIAKDPSGFPIVDRRLMLCTINDKREHSFADVAAAIWTAWEETPTNYSAARFARERFGIAAFRGGSAVTWCLNPVLRGGITSGRANRQGLYDTVLESQFEPMIDPDRHRAAVAAYLRSRADNNRPRGTNAKASPLSGKVRCAECGKSMVLHRILTRPTTQPTFRCRWEGCSLANRRIRYSVLREAIRQHLLQRPDGVLSALAGLYSTPVVDRDLERAIKKQEAAVKQLRDTYAMVPSDEILRVLDREEAKLAELQATQNQPTQPTDPMELIRWLPSIYGVELEAKHLGDDNYQVFVPLPKSTDTPADGVARLLRADVFEEQEASLLKLLVHHVKVNAASGEIKVVDLLPPEVSTTPAQG